MTDDTVENDSTFEGQAEPPAPLQMRPSENAPPAYPPAQDAAYAPQVAPLPMGQEPAQMGGAAGYVPGGAPQAPLQMNAPQGSIPLQPTDAPLPGPAAGVQEGPAAGAPLAMPQALPTETAPAEFGQGTDGAEADRGELRLADAGAGEQQGDANESGDEADSSLIDEVFETLFGSPGESEPHEPIVDQVERATQLVSRQVRGFALALIQHMEDDPSSIRALEGLIVLGLAHPQVLERLRIPIAEEGRRLALLLESRGNPERAQSLLEILASRSPDDAALDQELTSMMRRTGNADLLIERYLERADEAIASGRAMDAIPWLQEVLMIDRNRRDVGRMIRDLRYQEKTGAVRRKATVKRGLWFIVITAAIAAIGWREYDLYQSYGQLPQAQSGNLESVQARLGAIQSFQRRNIVWHGVLSANRERVRLRTEALRLELQLADEAVRARETAPPTTAELAETARIDGRRLAENREFEAALVSLRKALELGPPDWEHRARIEADIEAITTHLETGEIPLTRGNN